MTVVWQYISSNLQINLRSSPSGTVTIIRRFGTFKKQNFASLQPSLNRHPPYPPSALTTLGRPSYLPSWLRSDLEILNGMSSPPLYSTNDVQSFTERLLRPRRRSRTLSLLTVSSSTTTTSRFEMRTLTLSPAVCSRPHIEEAYGSFIPARSAASCLRDFANGHTTIIPRSSAKRRRVTFKDVDSPLSSDDDDDQSSFPHLNRPFPTTPKKIHHRPPIPSSPIKTAHHTISSSGIHPILAKIERESKLCTQIVCCSTCGKPGQDYPRCGKCGVLWCSRTCRLVAGKRHMCPAAV